MKAIHVHEFGGPEVMKYEDAEEPQAGPGQVLIEVRAAGAGAETSATTAAAANVHVNTLFMWPILPKMKSMLCPPVPLGTPQGGR